MQVFSPAFLVERVDDVEVGDKIIMHASFLKTCEVKCVSHRFPVS